MGFFVVLVGLVLFIGGGVFCNVFQIWTVKLGLRSDGCFMHFCKCCPFITFYN